MRRKAQTLKVAFIGLCGALLLSACSHQGALESFNNQYYNGEDANAYKFAKSEAGEDGDVLWSLQAGVSGFGIGAEDSAALLEQGEGLFSKYEAEGLLGGIFGNVGAVLVNDNVKSYRGNIYEGVMFNYYKALNAMEAGDYALARVEFNRANDRQRRAKDYFTKDIQKAMSEEQKQNEENETLRSVDSESASASISSLLEKEYSNLKKFHAYEGFINPAVSYVSGLFFLSEGDYSKASDLLKEAYGISNALVISHDMELIKKRKSGDKKKYTWLIIEDGKSASKYDASINIPSIYVSSSVLHVGVSVPMLSEGMAAASVYQVRSANGASFKAFEVGDLDGVIVNEFQKQLPFVLTRAITSAILKASTQALLSDQLGTAGALAGMLYSAGTTGADVRIATALPKRVLAAQVPNQGGDFRIYADSVGLFDVKFACKKETDSEQSVQKSPNEIILCEKNDNILYLRIKGRNPIARILKGGLE